MYVRVALYRIHSDGEVAYSKDLPRDNTSLDYLFICEWQEQACAGAGTNQWLTCFPVNLLIIHVLFAGHLFNIKYLSDESFKLNIFSILGLMFPQKYVLFESFKSTM